VCDRVVRAGMSAIRCVVVQMWTSVRRCAVSASTADVATLWAVSSASVSLATTTTPSESSVTVRPSRVTVPAVTFPAAQRHR